ncbi:hypothetical protein [Micromonospora aurantiaca (nom. illeg.)]|uniref:hypothetical protein n=1 Tax=Micromonospora aurantiaca (nom. illeg.) TaxID=47850 RepID=UPI0001BF3466|nr:hypothetical protein [Micromonospora aurantiaca]ADL44638.1 hypothetical protein Micau_1076 [Micromonospora aurantiaca ATCC 27029]
MNDDEWYERHGLRPADVEPVRSMLREQIRLGADNDSALIHLGCEQLFLHGDLADVLLIWQAKHSSFDAACSVEWQLLCGAGRGGSRRSLTCGRSARRRRPRFSPTCRLSIPRT